MLDFNHIEKNQEQSNPVDETPDLAGAHNCRFAAVSDLLSSVSLPQY